MKITVATVFHNEIEFLPKWYESVKTYADEIILAAHAPVDGSLEWAKQKQQDNEIPIQIVEFPKDTIYKHGFCHMKNIIAAKATGDWIVSLDADEEMDMTKDTLKPFTQDRSVCVSTMTMHMTERRDHWTLDNREIIKQEANWINQRHWRIYRNGLGIEWIGLIHEELRLPNGIHVARFSRTSPIRMWHYGSMANPSKRGFKDGLYAELLLRVVEQPELRAGTSKWWYTEYFDQNKEKLYKDREEYRKVIPTLFENAQTA